MVEIERLGSDDDGFESIAVMNRESGFGMDRLLILWRFQIAHRREPLRRTVPRRACGGFVLGKVGSFYKTGVADGKRFEVGNVI